MKSIFNGYPAQPMVKRCREKHDEGKPWLLQTEPIPAGKIRPYALVKSYYITNDKKSSSHLHGGDKYLQATIYTLFL